MTTNRKNTQVKINSFEASENMHKCPLKTPNATSANEIHYWQLLEYTQQAHNIYTMCHNL